MDADTLECPICSESFSPPVFQVCMKCIHMICTFPNACVVFKSNNLSTSLARCGIFFGTVLSQDL